MSPTAVGTCNLELKEKMHSCEARGAMNRRQGDASRLDTPNTSVRRPALILAKTSVDGVYIWTRLRQRFLHMAKINIT